jgi:hypothetical protein
VIISDLIFCSFCGGDFDFGVGDLGFIGGRDFDFELPPSFLFRFVLFFLLRDLYL